MADESNENITPPSDQIMYDRQSNNMDISRQSGRPKQRTRMCKIMDMIYANSQCASIYFQMFDMQRVRQHLTGIDSAKYTMPLMSDITADQKGSFSGSLASIKAIPARITSNGNPSMSNLMSEGDQSTKGRGGNWANAASKSN